jgi:nitric oxide reductase subunit B
MENTRKLWLALGSLLVLSFAVLLLMGGEIYRQAPPIPDAVISEDGTVLYTGDDIRNGRRVWQSMGGMQLGSIWGHGSYVAPDWSADWLHREAVAVLDRWAQRDLAATDYDALDAEQRAALRGRLETRMRTNTYDAATNTVTLRADRAAANAVVAEHYAGCSATNPRLPTCAKRTP